MTESLETGSSKAPSFPKSKKENKGSGLNFLLLLVKSSELLALGGAIGAIALYFLSSRKENFLIVGVIASIGVLILYIIERQLQRSVNENRTNEYRRLKAQLYLYLLEPEQPIDSNQILALREQALAYCEDLVKDYKKVRARSRNLYYILQIVTIILSGLTPIFVLIDKLETQAAWIQWLPVALPAIAAILASLATSFPLQENYISANKAVEYLEAEQEKFILGITKPYRCFLAKEPKKRTQKALLAIENFIVQVNSIHLSQLQQNTEAESEEQESEEEKESAQKQPEPSPLTDLKTS